MFNKTLFSLLVGILLIIPLSSNAAEACIPKGVASVSYCASYNSAISCNTQTSGACIWAEEGGGPVIPEGGGGVVTGNNSGGAPTVVQLQNPLGDINTPMELVGKILNTFFGMMGTLALVMFIFGGITWMTSAGNAEKVKKGRDILIWAAIGLFVIFSAYTLVRFVLGTIAA